LLLDKTGTITLGNRQAVALHPAAGVELAALADAAQLASLADETPEGRSIVILAKEKFGMRERKVGQAQMHFVPFSANTRMSGVDIPADVSNASSRIRSIRKGALDAIEKQLAASHAMLAPEVRRSADDIARKGGTPLVVSEATPGGVARALGVIEL